MSGISASVLLRSAFTAVDTGSVTDFLKQHGDDVTETRKGRHWTFVANNAVASLSVLHTATHEYDFEDDLIRNGLDYDDAPEAFVLTFPTRRECDREKCALLVRDLAETFGGIACG